MKIKIKKINRILATIIIASIILSAFFTPVNSSSLINVNDEKKPKEIDKTIRLNSSDTPNLEKESMIKEKNNYDIKNSITKLRIFINLIKLIFKDNQEIVSLCQKAHVILQKLPDFICRIIYWFILYPIAEILSYIWYNHPDSYIQYYAFLLLQFFDKVYYSICYWYPSSSELIYRIASLSELIGSSKERTCPCMEG